MSHDLAVAMGADGSAALRAAQVKCTIFFGGEFSVFVVKEKAAAQPPKDRCLLKPAEPYTISTAAGIPPDLQRNGAWRLPISAQPAIAPASP